MKVGRRLAIKMLNASKFVLGTAGAVPADPALVTRPLDQAMLGELGRVVAECTTAFDGYDYAALARTHRTILLELLRRLRRARQGPCL